MQVIHYQGGYKYQLVDQVVQVQTSIRPPAEIVTNYIGLSKAGVLSVFNGYAWDGPSGPTFDTKSFMRGSLFHDALYQLMRNELLSRKWRNAADRLLREVCLEDGMLKVRAWWVYQAVKLAAGPAAHPNNRRRVLTAP